MITIGIPAYNEEKNIAKVIVQLQDKGYSIIVCDDGSSDMTAKIAEKMNVIVIRHEKNLGYGAAIRSIFLKAKELNTDSLVTFDADGQHRVEDITSLIEPLTKDKADIVIGSRFLGQDESNIPNYRKTGIKVITKIANISGEKELTDSQSGLRAYNSKALESITPSENGMGVSTEILIKANKANLKIFEIPVTILYEGNTSTHHPVSHGASVIVSTMKFISIERPLKFYGIPGVVLLSIGLFLVFGQFRDLLKLDK
ncbi:glycosyl transferase family protein [Candidatus Nitrosopumilus koreensis AR1]|uniref:Glycosyl transferase family protein n=1 Tax=Candidatus Nitrosopumilus koreensis AR1 TaxID=1229908 RepID=K0B1W4_9ARCH|nr:glycosyltransferase family 2 protein [Candidatus Nitrosopumilus koreensis]AFS79998.1 glycosyl transferase family protein [Candidatus Nitrosopumilus koreensis AR1]